MTKNYRQDLEGLKLSNAIINKEHYELPNTQTPINADEIHLCYYNKTRRQINKQLNTPTPESVKIILNEDIDDVKPITGFLHKGVKVICNKTIKGAFVNSEPATIESVDDIITFTDGRSVELKTFSTHFTLSYAITVYKAQGQTYTQKVNIHDIDMMLTNYKFIYTAISRATEYKNLFFRIRNCVPEPR